MLRRSFLALSAGILVAGAGSRLGAQQEPYPQLLPYPGDGAVMRVSKFYCLDEVSDVPLMGGGNPMLFGSAFMAAGIYTLGGQSWDCRRPGLYRFMLDGEQFFRNRIVAGSPVDLYALISAMCWNHMHGSADETTDFQGLSNKGVHQRWRLRCGVIVALAVWLLPQLGQPSRSVNVITTGPLNGFDDGHIILETLHGSSWRMWDLTNGCYWTDASGNHLSTAQFIAAIANGGAFPTKVRLDGADKRWDAETAQVAGGVLDMGLYGDIVVAPNMEAWFRRIFQAIQ
jgi:hypothetical protein